MKFPYKLVDLTHTLASNIPTWDGGCGFNHDLHLDYADCEEEDKFRVMKISMHADIGTIWMLQAIASWTENAFKDLM